MLRSVLSSFGRLRRRCAALLHAAAFFTFRTRRPIVVDHLRTFSTGTVGYRRREVLRGR